MKRGAAALDHLVIDLALLFALLLKYINFILQYLCVRPIFQLYIPRRDQVIHRQQLFVSVYVGGEYRLTLTKLKSIGIHGYGVDV